MKLARLGDFKRRLRERSSDWPIRMERFSFEQIPSLGSGEIPLGFPIVVLAGPNGVGKTTLLKALWAAASPVHSSLGPSTSLKLSGGTAKLEWTDSGAPIESNVTFVRGQISGVDQSNFEVIHLDIAFDAKRLQADFCSFAAIEDIINGVGMRTLDSKDLVEVNYVSRREYREIKIYETDADNDAVPFFEVALGNDRYDSRTMGAGELSLLYLWWAIDRAPERALLLIEEPETYLSPASQEALTHFIIMSTVQKWLNVVITSHSAKIIGCFRDENLVFLFRDGVGIKIAENPVPPVLRSNIGLSSQIDTFVLVEDQAAKEFLRRMLERHQPALARRMEICVREGEGNIVASLKTMGGVFKAAKIIGMFDGDMDGRIPKEIAAYSALLPGNKAIEKIFREVIEADPGRFSAVTGCTNVAAILFGLQGDDCHDWYSGLCSQLGLSKDQLFHILFQIWHDQPHNVLSTKKSIDALMSLIAYDAN